MLSHHLSDSHHLYQPVLPFLFLEQLSTYIKVRLKQRLGEAAKTKVEHLSHVFICWLEAKYVWVEKKVEAFVLTCPSVTFVN